MHIAATSPLSRLLSLPRLPTILSGILYIIAQVASLLVSFARFQDEGWREDDDKGFLHETLLQMFFLEFIASIVEYIFVHNNEGIFSSTLHTTTFI